MRGFVCVTPSDLHLEVSEVEGRIISLPPVSEQVGFDG